MPAAIRAGTGDDLGEPDARHDADDERGEHDEHAVELWQRTEHERPPFTEWDSILTRSTQEIKRWNL